VIARWRVLLLLLLLGFAPGGQAAPGAVWVLSIDDAIGPASADYLLRSLDQAQAQGAQLVVIRMDTPGGLDSAMRQIIKAILASPVPVATYVAPSGAGRPAPAPTSSTPAMSRPWPPAPTWAPPRRCRSACREPEKAADNNEETLARKQVNDAAAYIRGLAQLRGRNADWAEKAVREAVSLSASEALRLNVIDQVASDLPDLLRKLDGQTWCRRPDRTTAHRSASVVEHLPDWRTRVLAVITNPSVALILIMIGVYGLLFEFMNPGTAVGGVVGGICLLLALYALQLLPVSHAGVALILLGWRSWSPKRSCPVSAWSVSAASSRSLPARHPDGHRRPRLRHPAGADRQPGRALGIVARWRAGHGLKARRRAWSAVTPGWWAAWSR
jgi:membrane-bound serine protease (ClpP class)